ncbi:Validoxylamine A glucosyltransferase [Paraconexibacter sp. AEG42_29]|uniref:Validoxylamine A glucosyltransferase n=1 Tax=Paraconexibacter sp. AEG42_29 TaxID=2997339 RepID=A0AAU7AU02_9ACTN
MRTALITTVAGRTAHLRRQTADVGRLPRRPDRQVVVAMGEGEAERARPACATSADLLEVPVERGELPLAAARNAGAARAIAGGAELLVFLDVDCLPGPGLLARYAAAADDGALLCGPVAYLPPAPPGGYPRDLTGLAAPHPARPVPPADVVLPGGDHRLFWTLSFAVTAATWTHLGGFDPGYVGYGGEDTDFGQRARAAGVDLRWVGGAWAFHQHHPTATPPVQHLDAILRNAARFHARWGWWPMEGWLQAFAADGLARFDPVDGTWCATAKSGPSRDARSIPGA